MTKKEKELRDGDRREQALRLFRIVHGSGDAGSEFEFDCLNPAVHEGWLAMAGVVLGLKAEIRERGRVIVKYIAALDEIKAGKQLKKQKSSDGSDSPR